MKKRLRLIEYQFSVEIMGLRPGVFWHLASRSEASLPPEACGLEHDAIFTLVTRQFSVLNLASQRENELFLSSLRTELVLADNKSTPDTLWETVHIPLAPLCRDRHASAK